MNPRLAPARFFAGFAFALAPLVLAQSAIAQTYVTLTNTNANSYTQNFDSLGTATIPNAISATTGVQTVLGSAVNAGLNGWHAAKIGGTGTAATPITANNGSFTSGGVANYGSTTAPASTNRSLGALSSGSTIPGFGALIVNETGQTLTGVQISFTAKFWRSSTSVQNVLTFGYGAVDGATVTTDNFITAAGATALPAANVVGPAPVASNGPLDGNDPTNQSPVSNLTIPQALAPGQAMYIRWQDANDAGNDAGLAVDDLRLTALAGAPPATAPFVAPVTVPPLGITRTQAGANSEVTGDGGSPITARGFVFSVSSVNPSPTLGGTGVSNAPDALAQVGPMAGTLTGLTASTTYAVCSYASNAVGTTYSSVTTFTTPDAPIAFLGNYSQSFATYTGTVPTGWTAVSSSNSSAYGGDWGTGSSAGFRGVGATTGSVLGYQHTASTGTLTVSVTFVNSTGALLDALDVSYLGRAALPANTRTPDWVVSFNGAVVDTLAYSTGNTDGAGGAPADLTKSTQLTGLGIAPGAEFTITWASERGAGSGSSRQIGLADFSIGSVDPTAPTIAVNPATITSLAAVSGQPGTAQSFQVSGSNLTGNLTVTAPANFEVSTTSAAAGFGGIATVTASGALPATNVWVRIASTAPTGAVGPENVTVSGGGATTRNVAVSGTVTGSGTASIVLDPTSATNLVAFVNQPGTAQQITVTGTGLSSPIQFTAAPSDQYEVAAQGGNFGVAATLPASGGVALVRIKSGATAGSVGFAQLTFDSGSISNTVALNGTRISGGTGGLEPGLQTFANDLNFTATARFVWVLKSDTVTGRGTEFSGVNVGGNLSVAAGASFDVVLNGAGSSTDFRTGFWKSAQSWRVFGVSGNTTGSFSLGAITPDSGGRYYAGYGSFGLSVTNGKDVYLNWTPFVPTGPFLSTSTETLSVPGISLGTNGASTNFTASGTNLVANIEVSVIGTNFAVSTNPTSGFGSLLVLTNNGGSVSAAPVYVRLNGGNAGTFTNSVSLASTGASTRFVSVTGTVTDPNAPAINISTNALTGFETTRGTPSSPPQNLTVTGTNLGSTNITVTSSNTSYEISTNSFLTPGSNALTLAPTGGVVAVRISTNAPATNNLTGSLALSSGATSTNVSLSGVVKEPPSLTSSTNSLTNFFTIQGTASPAQSYTLSGSNIFTNVTVTAPANFQVALTNTNTAFGSTVAPVVSNGVLSTNVFVRVAPSAATNTNLTGTITNSVGALTNTLVSLQARVVPAPTLSAVPTALSNFSTITGIASTNQSFNLTASNLLGPVNLSVTNGYEISLSTNSGFATNLAVAPTSAADNAGNYTSATWTNGANAGAGFGPWVIAANGGSGSAGVFIGNPAAAGIGGMATNSFGLYANPTNSGSFATAERNLSTALVLGQVLTFEWGINFDSGSGGNKGFNLFVGTNEVVNVNNGGSQTITLNGSDVGFGYGTNAMTWSFTRTASNILSITANDRDGTGSFSTNLVISSTNAAVSSLKFYASAMQAGDAAQPYFNNFQVAYPGGNISNLPVYVRIGTNAPVAEATNSLISRVTISSTSATNTFVNLSGSVASNPVITVSNSLAQFSAVQGFPSDPQQFQVGGINLLTNVLVTPPAGYQVSLDGIAWAATTNVPELPKVGVTTPQTNVFIRVADTAPTGAASGDVVLSSAQASNVLVPVSRVVGANTGPQLLATPTVLPAFATELGTASATNSFVLTGSGLSNSVALTAPSGFEISTNNGATFVSNGNLAPRASGFISNNISVRLTGSPAGIFSGNVTASAPNATPASVSVVGTVYTNALAQIAATPRALSNFATTNGTPSASQSFLGSARNLTNDLVATASGGYEVSTNNTDFFASVNVAPVSSNVAPVAFHARISSNALPANPLVGAVTLSSGAAPTTVVTLDGEVYPVRPLSVVLTAPTNNPTIIAPGSTVRLSATVSDTNTSGQPVQIATFEFRTNNVAIPGAFVTNVVSPYTLTYDWTPSPADLSADVSAWAVDVDGWEGSSVSVEVRNPDPGEPIVGFTPPRLFPTNSQIGAVAPATAGSFYVGGSFAGLVSDYGSFSVTNSAARLARIFADGEVDTDFDAGSGPNGEVRVMLFSARDKGLYIGGVFTAVAGVERTGLARLAVGQSDVVDGTLDTAFVPVFGGVSAPVINAIVQQYDGKILVGGIFATANGAESANLARLHPDGSLDESFVPPLPNGEVKSIALQPDGRILIGGSFAEVTGKERKGVARLNIDGSLDETFRIGSGPTGGFSGAVWSVAVALDGSIYVGGQFSFIDGFSVYNNLSKLLPDGRAVRNFNYSDSAVGGIYTEGGASSIVRNVQVRPGGGILVSGQFTAVSNRVLFPGVTVPVGRIAEFLADGNVDPNFNNGGAGANNSVLSSATLPDGNIVLVGPFSSYNGQPAPRVVVLAGSSAAAPMVGPPSFLTVDAGGEVDFSFSSPSGGPYDNGGAPLPRGVDFNAAAGALTGIPLDAGPFDMNVSVAAPGGGFGPASPFRLQVLPKKVPYETWKRVWFKPSDWANASVSGPSAGRTNPSGQPNLTVYALNGGNPMTLGQIVLPSVSPDYVEGQEFMTYGLSRYPLADAIYRVQTSGDLRTWGTNTVTIDDEAGFFRVRPAVPMSLTNRQYFRLKISLP